MFSLFSCCFIDSFMNWSIFVKCGIKHVNKCVRVHLTTGGYFYSFMSLIFFNYPLFLLQFHHFFHFFNVVLQFSLWYSVPSIVMLYWMESTFAVYYYPKNCTACML